MAADIFESYEVTIVSGLILGIALTAVTGHVEWILYPLLVRGIGVLASIVGTYLVKGQSNGRGDAMAAIFRGFLTSAAISRGAVWPGGVLLYGRGAGRLVAAVSLHHGGCYAGHPHRPADRLLYRVPCQTSGGD
jgi:Na+/H+-translocating membrane pyrophosphatase